MKIGLLSNSSLSIPTLQMLMTEQKVEKVGIPIPLQIITESIQKMLQQMQFPLHTFAKETLEEQLQEWCKGLDAVIVMGFPWKIPASCLSVPTKGFFNYHFAPLPEYRGSAPLFWVIKNREPQNKLSIHKMDAHFDRGPIVFEASIPILPNETMGQHMGRLSVSTVNWTKTFLYRLTNDRLEESPQTSAKAKYWPKPKAQDLQLDWKQQSAAQIMALVKASNPHYGGAFCWYQELPFRVLEVSSVQSPGLQQILQPGIILHSPQAPDLFVYCKGGGLLRIDVIKLEEGYFPGWKLFELGVQVGSFFSNG